MDAILTSRFPECKKGYKLCGTSYCIPKSASCISGMPGRRSLELPTLDNTQNLCPPGLEACYTSDMSMKYGRPVGWECVDTSSDVESCGGCEWPVAGQQQGQDCSDMAGVSRVSVSPKRCSYAWRADFVRSVTEDNARQRLVCEALKRMERNASSRPSEHSGKPYRRTEIL